MWVFVNVLVVVVSLSFASAATLLDKIKDDPELSEVSTIVFYAFFVLQQKPTFFHDF